MIDPRWAPILQGTGIADELLEFPREKFRGPAGTARALRWFAALPRRRPDLAIDLQGLLRSALIARAARPRRTLGLSDAREGARHFYTATADTSKTLHAVDRYLQILPLLDLPIPTTKQFPLPPITNNQSPITPSLLLHPYARGAAKSLPAATVRALCQLLPEISITLVGIGPTIPDLPANVTDLTNRTTLPELIDHLRSARAVISVDSGPMHLAAALNRPLLAIHTWSDPRKVGPYSDRAWIYQGGGIRPQSLDPAAPLLPEAPIDPATLATWARQNHQPITNN